jgi:hypothetical protein
MMEEVANSYADDVEHLKITSCVLAMQVDLPKRCKREQGEATPIRNFQTINRL